MAALTNTRRKRTTPWSRLGIAAALLGGGLLLGAVLLGLQWYSWSALARNLDYSKLSEMESASLILDRNGELLGRIFLQNRDQKPLAEISPLLQKALISSEDARFYEHSGVDPTGIASTLFRSIKAFKLTGGASTLSQQLARNTFPQDLPQNDKSLRRKIQEMFVAKEVEKHLTKAQILEYYLNRVYFGSGFYGAEAASQGYFGKKSLELNAAESALLIGLLPNPTNRSPWNNRKLCIEARNRVLARMRELSHLSEAQYQAALSEEPKVKRRPLNLRESYATDLVTTFMRNLVGGEESMSGGYRIFTTIDQALQRKAEQALLAHLQRIEQKPEYPKQRQTYAQFSEIYREYKAAQAAGAEKTAPKPEYLQGTVVLLDNASGAIRAIVGGRDPLHSEFNRAVDGAVPPGSAFLPLVFATAFEKGLHPGTIVQDAPMDNRLVMVGGTSGILGEWSREQAGTHWEGPVTARTALIKSKNAASVRLGTLILGDTKPSLEAVAAFARAAGIESPMRAFPASFLGSSELKPLELALAYSCFPGGGTRPAATLLVDRVEDRQGKVVFQSAPGRVPVCSAGPAYQVHECLAANLTEGPAAQVLTNLGTKRVPIAGKSGTAYNFTANWFVGYSSEITCAVWIGLDKPRTPIFFGAFGTDLALPLWAELMNESFAAFPPKPIAQPAQLQPCRICAASGYLPHPQCLQPGPDGQPQGPLTEVWMTPLQRPKDKELCDVHGPKRPRVPHAPEAVDLPKVMVVVDTASIAPIALQSPVIAGEDPFLSNQSEQVAKAIKNYKDNATVAPLENKIPEIQKPEPTLPTVPPPSLPRAIPVTPENEPPPASKLPQAPKVPKLEF